MTTEDQPAVPGSHPAESTHPHRLPDDTPDKRRSARTMIWIDVVVAFILIAGAMWFYNEMQWLYLHADLRWHHEDNGMRLELVEDAVGIVFWLAPAALLCTLASLSMWRGWHGRWVIQMAAGAWALLGPILMLALEGVAMRIALTGCPSNCWIGIFSPA
jgi:hypothetical protein